MWSGDSSNGLPSRPSRADINVPRDGEGNTYLHELCRKNAPAELIRDAIEILGANPNILNRKNMPPLGVAIQNAGPEAVTCLVSHGAEVFFPVGKDSFFNAAYLACDLGREEALKALLGGGGALFVNSPGSGADGSKNRWNALHIALRNGRDVLVDPLIKAGADLNSEAGFAGMTPLFLAIANDAGGTVRKLVSNGADLEAKQSDNGRTPLAFAAFSKSRNALRVLLQCGADANAADKSGATPLMLAAEAGDAAMVDLLLQNKADPNARRLGAGGSGETALMKAAQKGASDVMRLLLKAGADPLLADTFNRTAARYAGDSNNYNARVFLEEVEQKSLQAQFETNYRKYRP